MKNTKLPIIVLIGALIVSACGAARTSSSGSGSTSANGSRFGTRAPRVLTPEAKLALGTIKLEGTPQAVDATMAAKLLPLWQLLAQMSGSNSTAPQEVTAVLDQIEATMTTQQVQAINSMQLTSADMFTAFQQQGQTGRSGGALSGGTRTPNSGSSASGNRGNGGGQTFLFGGGGGGGGFGGGGLGNTGGNRSSTGTTQSGSSSSSAQSAQSASNAISLILVNQVIQMLQARITS